MNNIKVFENDLPDGLDLSNENLPKLPLFYTVGSKGKVDTWSWFVSDSSCFSTFIHSHAQADWFSFHSFFEK